MAEDKNIYKLKTIKPGAEVTIKIGGIYFKQLQDLIGFIYQAAPSEAEAIKSIEALSRGRVPENDWEYIFTLVISLLFDIEQKAEEQGMTQIEEIIAPKD